MVFGPVFVLLIAYIVWSLILSALTYRKYALDKAAAAEGSWRTTECALYTWGIVGGWPGGLLAQHRLRHKIKKCGFQVIFWITVVINVSISITVLVLFSQYVPNWS